MKYAIKAISSKASSRAYSYLEFVAVLPVLLSLVLGAIDLNSMVQSYLALRAGVQTALRCVYTVDGRCVDSQAASPRRNFDWYSSCSRSELLVDRYDYDGEASWIEHPTYTFTDLRAVVLRNVHFDVPSTASFRARLPYYRAVADVDLNMQLTDSPYLAGTDPRNPRVVFQQDRDVNYPHPIPFQFSSSRTVNSTNDVIIGSFSIPTPVANPSLPCFNSERFNERRGAPHSPNLGAACENSPTRPFPMAIWLKGTQTHSAGINSAVTLRVVRQRRRGEPPHADDNQLLGGQQIGGVLAHSAAPANFYPRGIRNSSRYMDSEIRFTDEERAVHGEYLHRLLARYGETYDVVLSLTPPQGAGSISWTATDVDIFTPLYAERPNQQIQCANPLRRDMVGCTAPGLPANVQLRNVRRAVPEVISYPRPDRDLGCQYNRETALDMLTDDRSNYDLVETPGVCATTHQASCPQIAASGRGGTRPNYGVREAGGADGGIRSSVEAAQICPAADAAMQTNGVVVSNISWDEVMQRLPAPESVSVSRNSCLGQLSVPPELSMYPKLAWPVAPSQTVYTPVNYSYSAEHSPQFLKDNDPQYSCAELPLKRRLFDEQHQLPPTSLFVGSQYDLGSCAEEVLRADAIANGMAPGAYLIHSAAPRGSTRIDIDERGAIGRCSPYRINHIPESRTFVAGPLSEGLTPPGCSELASNCVCTAQFHSFSGGEPPSGPDFDAELAVREYGYREIRAAMPRARFDCEGDNCINMNVDSRQLNGVRSLAVSASTQVPLNLMLGRSLQLSYSDNRTWEGEFAR